MKTRRTICLYSLGCPKNLVDSENLVSTLISRGFQVLRDPDEADMVLVNTCGFLDAARAEAIDEIRRAARHKHTPARAGAWSWPAASCSATAPGCFNGAPISTP